MQRSILIGTIRLLKVNKTHDKKLSNSLFSFIPKNQKSVIFRLFHKISYFFHINIFSDTFEHLVAWLDFKCLIFRLKFALNIELS